tara:strand:- start:874 stop:1200 length:327 start_codon:yes stop_codon:yes gene_type:complete
MGRYRDIDIILSTGKKARANKRIYETVKYPRVPLSNTDIYVYAEEGDRFDQLAETYYGDSSLWWIISIANESLQQNSYFLPLGSQVRIPQNIGAIKTEYYKLNHRDEL